VRIHRRDRAARAAQQHKLAAGVTRSARPKPAARSDRLRAEKSEKDLLLYVYVLYTPFELWASRSPRCRCVGCLLDRSGPMTRLFAVPRSFACCLRRATDELARCPQHTAPTSPRRTLDCQPAPPILAPRHVHHHLRVRHRMHGRPQARHGCVHSPLCRYCARAAA
jgi:hypothetical protein